MLDSVGSNPTRSTMEDYVIPEGHKCWTTTRADGTGGGGIVFTATDDELEELRVKLKIPPTDVFKEITPEEFDYQWNVIPW